MGIEVEVVSKELPSNIESRIQPETADPEGVERVTDKRKYKTTVTGRIVWSNGKPVVDCSVKQVNKIELVKGKYWGMSVRQFTIPDNAYEEEMEVDSSGRFKFEGIPPGIYYLFWRAPESENGDEWAYMYTQSPYVIYLMGAMPEPIRQSVKKGKTVIPDIKIKRPKSAKN